MGSGRAVGLSAGPPASRPAAAQHMSSEQVKNWGTETAAMYGTIFRMKVKAGQESKVVDVFREWDWVRQHEVKGIMASFLLRPASYSGEMLGVARPPTGPTPRTLPSTSGTSSCGSFCKMTRSGRMGTTLWAVPARVRPEPPDRAPAQGPPSTNALEKGWIDIPPLGEHAGNLNAGL
jgi:hypothetical protein